MVNRYISAEQAEAESPYAGNTPAPTTAREAEIIASHAADNRGTYAGRGNELAYDALVKQRAQEAESARQAAVLAKQQQAQRDYAAQAREDAQKRAGYTREENLGDVRTQQIVGIAESQRGVFRAAGVELPSRDLLTGMTLESQRQAAVQTPGIRDDQYFSNELSKWAQNKVETGAAYHNVGRKSDVAIPENPFELQADLAVEFLKGSPDKRSEYFSPASGKMSQFLPNDTGLQEDIWNVAKTRVASRNDYMPAVSVLGTTSGTLREGNVGTPVGNVNTDVFIPTTQVAGQKAPGIKFTGTIEKVTPENFVDIRTEPTGEIPFITLATDINPVQGRIFEIKDVAIPFVSERIIKPFQKDVITPAGTTYEEPVKIREYQPGEAAYTRSFVNVEGKKVQSLETVSGGSREAENLKVSMDTQLSAIEERKANLNYAAAQNIDEKGHWVGPESDMAKFNAEQATLESDVAKYNVNVEKYNKLNKENPPVVTTTTLGEYGTQKVTPVFKSTEGSSEIERVFSPVTNKIKTIDTGIQGMLPSAEVGEQATRMVSLTNPFTVQPVVTSMFLEKFAPEAAPAARTVESIVGYKGQYTQFRESPTMAVTSYGAGVLFGGVTKGASMVVSKVGTVSPKAAWAMKGVGSVVGMGMGALYVADVGSRATQGGTNFAPESVISRTKAIAVQETVPLGIGFGHGYAPVKTINAFGEVFQQKEIGIPAGYTKGVVVKAEPTIVMKEPVAQKKQVGYSVDQMLMGYKMKNAKIPIPEAYTRGVPAAYNVPDPTAFYYQSETMPIAGGRSPVGNVRGFEPSSSVNKMIESAGPVLEIRTSTPTYGVANSKNLYRYGKGEISPVSIGNIPGTNIRKLVASDEIVSNRIGLETIPGTNIRRPIRPKPEKISGGGGGGGSGGVIGNVGTRGGVILDIKTGKRVLSKQDIKAEQSFAVSSGIFQTGTTQELSMSRGMTLEHLSPYANRKYRLVEDMQPESVYYGKIPGVTRPQPPADILASVPKQSNIRNADIAVKIGGIHANRQSQLVRPALALGSIVSQRSRERLVSERSAVQERAREQAFSVKTVPLVAVRAGQAAITRTRQDQVITAVPVSRQAVKQNPMLKTDLFKVTIPKVETQRRTTVTPEPTKPTLPKTTLPELPISPVLGGGGIGGGYQERQYYRGLVEHSPAWTVSEMAGSLFSGRLRPIKRQPVRKEKPIKQDRSFKKGRRH